MKKSLVAVAAAATLCISTFANATTLKIADNHNKNDSTVKALKYFAKNLKTATDGDLKAKVFPNGVLGDESAVLQGIQQGIIDIARVSTANLRNFQPEFGVLSMPYLFRDMDHFKTFAKSNVAETLLHSTKDSGIIGVTFYTNGFRSFYTKDKLITKPEDLDGLKIRVMGDPTAIEMVNRLGGKATPMAYSEVFSAIQQGVLDGAESAVTVLTNGSHGEVAKAFSFDEHSLLADVVVVSQKTLDKLNDKEEAILFEELKKSWEYQDKLFNEDIEHAYNTAKSKMGVKFTTLDKAPFVELVQPMYEALPSDQKKVADDIKSL